MGHGPRPHPLRACVPFVVSALVVGGFGLSGRGQSATAPLPSIGDQASCAVVAVQDGDSLSVDCAHGTFRVRVWGLDAPELGQRPWGAASRQALGQALSDTVLVDTVDHDRYGRAVARLHDQGEDLGLALVRAGQAAVYRPYNDDPHYLAAEAEARRAGRGIWSAPGFQQTPWRWRRFNPPEKGR